MVPLPQVTSLTMRLRAAATLAVAVAMTGCLSLLDNRPAPRSLRVEQLGAPERDALAADFRVVTYNTYGMSADVLARALSTAPLVGADLIFLQEVERHAHEPHSRACGAAIRLGYACAYAPGHRLGDGGDLGVAILSRAPILTPLVIELPFIHTVLRSGRRIALAASVPREGGAVRVISVHLDNRITPSQRIRQMRPVLRDAQAAPGPVVVAGDVNTTPFTWLANLVPIPTGTQDDRLEAAVRAAGMDTPVTGSGPTSPWLHMRLDAVYTRGLRVSHHGVAANIRASDHLPLWAALTPTRSSN